MSQKKGVIVSLRRTWNSRLLYRHQPIYCTIYLFVTCITQLCLILPTTVNSLYSLPVCGVSTRLISPGFTCFRAGFSFLPFPSYKTSAGATVPLILRKSLAETGSKKLECPSSLPQDALWAH